MLRRQSTRLLKTAVLLFLLTFLWLQLYITHLEPHHFSTSQCSSDNLSDSQYRTALSEYSDTDSLTDGFTHQIISTKVEEYNTYQIVRNADVYGDVTVDTVVVLIQVHTRIKYLNHLIESLSTATDINKTLVIFSHDAFDANINAVVKQISFCRVMQIFYPYSIQLHPNSFPGESVDDCPRNYKKKQALEKGCINAEYADRYGHYREAKFTQTKHHWWWKIHRVFYQLDVMRGHKGWVVLLEEDHYVFPDFLPLIDKLWEARETHCKDCNILSLGTYLKHHNYVTDSMKAEATQWVSSKHNMGMVLWAASWHNIKVCSRHFCTYDDYNWDWSLQYIGQTCMKPPLKVLLLKAPRVFHIGECGIHHKKKDCTSAGALQVVEQILSSAKPFLFPSSLTVMQTSKKNLKVPKGNGGWGDRRDHDLCLNMSLPSS